MALMCEQHCFCCYCLARTVRVAVTLACCTSRARPGLVLAFKPEKNAQIKRKQC